MQITVRIRDVSVMIGIFSLGLFGCIGAGKNSPMVVHTADQIFPTLEGIDLLGKERIVPAGLTGDPRLVIIAFEQNQQSQVDTWIQAIDQIRPLNPQLSFFELPVIESSSAPFRFWVNNGMRSGVPSDVARERTITVYTDRAKFQTVTSTASTTITTFLLNSEGRILWRTDGAADSEKISALKVLLSSM